VDTETGEFTEKTLAHEGNKVREFYAGLEGYPETIDTTLIPSVDLPAEHQKLMARLLLQNRAVSIDINVENSFSAGPDPSDDIVGEIHGAVYPEKVVLVGAPDKVSPVDLLISRQRTSHQTHSSGQRPEHIALTPTGKRSVTSSASTVFGISGCNPSLTAALL